MAANSFKLKVSGMESRHIIDRIKRIEMGDQIEENDLRKTFVAMVQSSSLVLDCGKSLREYHNIVKEKVRILDTIDINQFEDYPNYLIDICNQNQMQKLKGKYDFIASFSLIEHCYDPISASNNLFESLKPSGLLIGSAPFLFPRHSPEDLSYQDFFRFTRDAYAILFPTASSIELHPLRGRAATSLNVLSTRYRFTFEKRMSFLANRLNKFGSKGRQALQSSGYGFIIRK